MSALQDLGQKFPDAAKDIKLNLSAVMSAEHLSAEQRYGVALACALNLKNDQLVAAILQDGKAYLSEHWIHDATAAASLMAMNNIYYRFVHMMDDKVYSQKSVRLRMNAMGKTQTSKADFELMSLAVSAINGCQMCLQSHAATLEQHGVNSDAVQDSVRIAAVVHAAVVGLSAGRVFDGTL